VKLLLPGVVLAVVAVVIVAMAFALSSDSSTDVTDLDVGDCFDLDLDADPDDGFADLTLVEPIDCDEPHTAQVVATRDLNPDQDLPFPGDGQLFEEADRWCGALVEEDDRFGTLPVTPTEATWDARRGRTLCVAVTFGGRPVQGDHRRISGGSGAGDG
jgi:hypothetical protein